MNSGHLSALAARVTSEQIEQALRGALKSLERHDHDHVGWAHQPGRGFEYRPDICPGCRLSVLRAVADKEVLYV